MKKALTLFLIFIVAASLLCIFAPQSYGQTIGLTEDLRVNSYNYYTSPITGAFVLIGEVQNIGTQIFHSARIRAVVYNSSGDYVAEPVISRTYADQLSPNETAAFYMYFTAASSATGDLSWVATDIDSIEFYCYGSSDSTPQDSGLHVIAHNGAATSSGNYSVTGMVLNRGTGYPEKSYVVGTFYDSSGSVVAIGISDYLTRYLAPNNVTAFTCGLYDALSGIGNQIASYSLRVVAEGTMTEPTPTPLATVAPTASPGTTPNPTTASSADPSNNDNTESSNTLYIALAAVGIAVAVVVLVLLLKRR